MTFSSKDFFSTGRALEDAFFLEQDRRLKEQLAALKKMEETKENLKQVSGIENDAVLQKMVELNIPPQIVASLSMVPLVEVAWADGEISPKEKKLIIKKAHLQSQIDNELLTSWLEHKPEQKMLEAWINYIKGLCEKLTDNERTMFRKAFLSNTYDIAKVEGGFLGIGSKISKKERAMLDILEKSFCNNC
ncbi:MAG: hypothetical protein JW795_09660 [Chitinivibrionales bacterium]|nr:hypothetical protein [Chitinivibrionales bacterium]